VDRCDDDRSFSITNTGCLEHKMNKDRPPVTGGRS